MAHNFHDICGMLVVGVDFHMGMQPLPPPPHPMMYWEMVFTHPFILGPGQKSSVKFNGVNSVVHMHSPLLLWGHLPMLPDPLNLIYWQDIIGGSHVCWLPRSAVKIEGTSATCCVFPGPASINMDCCEWGIMPLSMVLQPGTVQTTPSFKDYLLGALAVVVNNAFEKGLPMLGEKLFKSKQGLRFARKFRKNAKTKPLIDKLATRLGRAPGLSDAAARKAGMNKIGDALGNILGNNPIESGKIALDLVGVDVPAHIRAAAQGDDAPEGPKIPSVHDVAKHVVKGVFPNAGGAYDAADKLRDPTK